MSAQESSIKQHLWSIQDIFDHRLFRVPDYQRGYSWTRENLDDFWRDISGLPENHVHYMGVVSVERPPIRQLERWSKESVLFSHLSTGPDSYSALVNVNGSQMCPYYIIDGQQRLLTIAILLSCLEKSGYLPEEDATVLRSQYIWIEADAERCYYLGYEVDVPSHRFLIREIYGGNRSDEIATAYTRSLGKAKEYFNDKVLDAGMNEVNSRRLFHTLTQRLKFNFYEVDRSIDVCVLFETMNNRGKPLSRLELLKNRLLYLSTQLQNAPDTDRSALRDVINDAWKDIYAWLAKEENETSLDDDDFLRAHWIMYYEHGGETGKHIRTSDFAQDLMVGRFCISRARNGKLTAEEITKYVNNLRESVKWWFAINYPSHNSTGLNPVLRRWLMCIREVKNNKSFFRPMIMAVLQRKDLADEDKEQLLRAIERHDFVVGHLAGTKASASRPHFWRQAHSVFFDGVVSDVVKDIANRQSKFYSQSKFADNIETLYAKYPKEDGGWTNWPALRYFLREYDKHLGSEGDMPHPGNLIEHILPKRMHQGESWIADFGNYSRPRRDKLCSSIGNLLLKARRDETPFLPDDRRTDRHSFQSKKARYEEASASEREVARYSRWGHQEILERGVKLLKFMAVRWDIPLGEEFCKQLTQVNFDGKNADGED